LSGSRFATAPGASLLTRKASSTLHLQIGQETIYLLLTVSLFAALIMLAFIVDTIPASDRKPDAPPPIIMLEETKGYSFASGSAILSEPFEEKLRNDIAIRVEQLAQAYGADIIEIVGHTDEVTLRRADNSASNLDKDLLDYMSGSSQRDLIAQDNVGLGMARAVAVARILKRAGLDNKFEIIPMSAGQLVLPGDYISDGTETRSDAGRRRIEIRVRKRPPPQASEPSSQ